MDSFHQSSTLAHIHTPPSLTLAFLGHVYTQGSNPPCSAKAPPFQTTFKLLLEKAEPGQKREASQAAPCT